MESKSYFGKKKQIRLGLASLGLGIGFFLMSGWQCRAVTGADSASNYTTWSSGDNQGTGFGPWEFNNNNNGTTKFAGGYLANASNPGERPAGIFRMDATGTAFSIYANPAGTYMSARRFLGDSSGIPLAVGESFRFQWVQHWGGGNKGINLYRGGWDDANNKVINLRQDGDQFVVQPRGSLTSPTAILNAYNNVTAIKVRQAAPDTLQVEVSTEDMADGTYNQTFRAPAPDRVSFYFSDGANGGNDEPLFNSLEVLEDPAPVATRTVTFSVDMSVVTSSGGFDPAGGDKIFVRGFASGGWGSPVECVASNGSSIYEVSLTVPGDVSLNSGGYKFWIEKSITSTSTVANGGYESVSDREFVLGVPDLVLPVVYFNNIAATRNISFSVDMNVATTKGSFVSASDTVEVRHQFDSFSGGHSLVQDGSTGVYRGTFLVGGEANVVLPYKFVVVRGLLSTWERVDAPRTNEFLNRALTLGVSGNAQVIPAAFFSNDDGVGPVITRTGASTINLTVGDLYTELGATALDAIEGSATATPSGTVNNTTAGSYTITYNAIDAAGNAATPVTRTVIVAAADPLADYMTSFGLSGVNATGNADPDGDGQDNNSEFAFGTSPTSGASRSATLVSGAGTIKLVYLQRNSGITYTVKSVTDLTTSFDTGGSVVEPTATSPQPSGLPAGYTQYEASLSTGSGKGFLRVKAVVP